MKLDNKEKIRELEEKIRILNEENFALSDRAEEIVLSAIIFEHLIEIDDKKSIINFILERICILKNIPFAAFGLLKKKKISIINRFSIDDLNGAIDGLKVPDAILPKILEKGGLAAGEFDESFPLPKKILPANFNSYLILSASLQTEDDVFVFFSKNSDSDELTKLIPLLTHLIGIVDIKFKNIDLHYKLEKQNKELESQISERTKQLEEKIANIQKMIDYSPDGVLIHKDNIITYANKSSLKIFEAENIEELIGVNVLSFLDEEQNDIAKQRIAEVKKRQFQPFQEYKISTLKGNKVFVEVSGIPIIEDNQILIHLTIRDINEHKKLQEELNKEKVFLKNILNAIKHPLIVVNPENYEVVLFNNLERSFVNPIGKKCYEVFHHLDEPCYLHNIKCPVKEVLANKKEVRLEHRHYSINGEINHYEIYGFPAFDEDNNLNYVIEYEINITERKQYEQKLLNFELGLEKLNEIVFVTDTNGVINYINPAFEKVYGYSEEEALGAKPNILKSGVYEESFYSQLWNTILAGKSLQAEIINRTKDDRLLHIDASISPIINKNKQLVGFLAVQRDITARVESEKEIKLKSDQLKLSEKRFKHLFNTAVDGILLADDNNKIISANDGICNLLKLKKSELEGEPLSKILSSEILQALNLPKLKVDKTATYESALKFGGNLEIPILFICRRLEKSLIQIYMRDLTEAKKAQETLRKSEERFRKLISLSPVGILLLQNKKIVYANKTLADTLGYDTPNELLGKMIMNFIHPDYFKIAQKRLAKLVTEKNASVGGMEEKFLKKDGSYLDVLIVGQSVEYEGKPAVQGYIYDISKRKKFEEELKFAKEKAEAADRMKSDFLAKISHEIRTPLNNIINYSSMINEEISESEKKDLDFAFAALKRSSLRIIRTVDLILNMSDLELGSYAPKINEFSLFDSVIMPIYNEYLSETEKKGIDFKVENSTKSSIVRGDSYSIYQIVSNLVDNAVKFTSSGKVNIRLNDEDDYILLTIQDTGEGIRREYLSDLFTPFSQEQEGYSRKFDGSGLGMALVKKYCDLNNITIEVASRKNAGTTFKLKIKCFDIN